MAGAGRRASGQTRGRKSPRLGSALAGLVDLVLPTVCVGCGIEDLEGSAGIAGVGGIGLCPGCAALLKGPARPTVPDPPPPGLPPTWTVAAYAGPVRAAVVAHKEEGRRILCRPLAAALAASAAAATAGTSGQVLLVPAPSRAAAVRERGQDPTLRLARTAAAYLRREGLDVVVIRALRVRAGTLDQAGLSATDRASNVGGAIWVTRRAARVVAGRRVLVVDDVVTSGATLAEASRALRAAGAEVVAAAVVAATRRTAGGSINQS